MPAGVVTCKAQRHGVSDESGARDCSELGRTPLFDPSAERVAEAFDRAVDGRVNVRSSDSHPYRARRVEGNGDRAAHSVARARALAGAEQDPSTAELGGVARQCREHAILSVSTRLRADGVGACENVNALHPQNESQAPGQ